MAIDTDSVIWTFGTQDEVTTAGSPLPQVVDGDGGISTVSDIGTWTNDDDAPLVAIALKVNFAAVPDTGTIDVYCTLDDIQSTNDEPDKDSGFPGHYLGSIDPDEVATEQYLALSPVALPVVGASQVYQFYIVNNQGDAAHDIAAGWQMWVTPLSYKPHA